MNRVHMLLTTVLVVGMSLVPFRAARAAVTVTVEAVGNDVVMSGGGTLDLSLWSFFTDAFSSPGVSANSDFALGGDFVDVDLYWMPTNFSGPNSIGPGSQPFAGDSGSGDPLGLSWNPGLLAIGVPDGYVSGDPITGSEAIFENSTIQSLGLSPGIYMWTWDTVTGGSDSFTIDVIPAPGALALLGLAVIAPRRRRA